jgi:hypothetical protein
MDNWSTAVEEGYRQGFADAGKIGIVVVVIIIVAVMGLR